MAPNVFLSRQIFLKHTFLIGNSLKFVTSLKGVAITILKIVLKTFIKNISRDQQDIFMVYNDMMKKQLYAVKQINTLFI